MSGANSYTTTDADEARKVMKRCQIGVPRRHDAYDELHSILAECYGTIGKLLNELERRDATHGGSK